MMQGWMEKLQRLAPDLVIREGVALRELTRFALGGPAAFLVDVKTASIVPEVVKVLRASGLPMVTIGGGSNLIAADAGFDGIVLRFFGAKIQRDAETTHAETGATWQAVVDFHCDLGLTGMERMTGIPGWLGGAVYGNAGAYGQTIMDFVETVAVFDGEGIRQIANRDCGFAYRTSGFKAHKDWVLLSAQIRLAAGDPLEVRQTAAEILATRNEKFPPTMKCAGSIFKNLFVAELPGKALNSVPPGVMRAGKVPSAWFLEQIGSKGMHCGGIEVANYHANLMYNTGKGTAAEACELIDRLQALVFEKFGLSLEAEVQYIGFPNRSSH